MGVVTVSSSASQAPLGLNQRLSSHQLLSRKPLFVAFKRRTNKKKSMVSPVDPGLLPIETARDPKKRCGLLSQPLRGAQAVSSGLASPYTVELDYNEAVAKLESIYKRSDPTESSSDNEDNPKRELIQRHRRKKLKYDGRENDSMTVVKSKVRKPKRLSLDTRIALKKNNKEKKLNEEKKKNENTAVSSVKMTKYVQSEDEKIDRLVRDYTASTDLVSLDWKKMKIPPVLPSAEQNWLFKLMQPMKALVEVKDHLQKELERYPKDHEIGEATNMTASVVKRHMEVGQAARNKLIKHNLRLVLFVMNKYFQEFTNGPNFQDLCQAGVKGLITAIDRFEPKRKFRLSTYGLFWIRHAIIRSMTVSSFTRVSFGLESVRLGIQKAKLELMFELNRMPIEEEIIERVEITPKRYQEVMRASNPIYSLNTKHAVTQEELINGITDVDGVGGDKRRQPALLRLALDDVLDSLKPKESLVIRQRYGLDGKGDRTLGEIAGNLNISREMVRKYELKGLMKLKHPARADYLRQYIY